MQDLKKVCCKFVAVIMMAKKQNIFKKSDQYQNGKKLYITPLYN